MSRKKNLIYLLWGVLMWVLHIQMMLLRYYCFFVRDLSLWFVLRPIFVNR